MAPAPAAWRGELERLLPVVGLRRAPPLLVVDASVSPMVCPSWRGLRLVVPRRLMAGLGPDQRAALLLHELAHVRRRDPWVRWLEVVAAGVLWWHPLVWLLRAGLHDAEERACDAWVCACAPPWRHGYARALVTAMESLAPVPLPLPHSGAVRLRGVKQRLESIMRDPSPHRIGSAGRVLVAVFALSLPVLPTTAQGVATPASDLDQATLATLKKVALEPAFVEAPLLDWVKFLQQVTGVPFTVSAAARDLDPERTTLSDFYLPKMSADRLLDVIAQVTDLRWSVQAGVVVLRAESKADRPSVQVVGRVRRAGAFPWTRKATLVSVLSAVGTKAGADLRRVLLVRSGEQPLVQQIDFRAMVLTGNTTYNVALQPGDLLVVPSVRPAVLPPERAAPGVRVRFLVSRDCLKIPGAGLLADLRKPQRVDRQGRILIPYVGRVEVAGRTEEEVETLVTARLGKIDAVPVVPLYARFEAPWAAAVTRSLRAGG